jgi:ribosome-binding protein aMBF1 (putative translation factor)
LFAANYQPPTTNSSIDNGLTPLLPLGGGGEKGSRRSGGFMPKAKKTKAPARKRSSAKNAKTPDLNVGEMMRSARESSSVSQEELALRLNTKRTAISRIENHAEDIKLSTLARVAAALGKTLKVKIV